MVITLDFDSNNLGSIPGEAKNEKAIIDIGDCFFTLLISLIPW